MRIVQIEDDCHKIQRLEHVLEKQVEVVEDGAQLDNFMQNKGSNAGVAVVDIGVFDSHGRQEMLDVVEQLADDDWRVICWSAAVGALDVREDCWFVNENSPDGAKAIAVAIEAVMNGNEIAVAGLLHRGEKSSNSLETALQALSGLLPFGLLWELKVLENGENQSAAKQDAAAGILGLDADAWVLDFERHVSRYVAAMVAGDQDQKEAARKELEAPKWNYWVQKLGEMIGEKSGGCVSNDTFACAIRALDDLAGKCTVQDWNTGLAELRDVWLGVDNAEVST